VGGLAAVVAAGIIAIVFLQVFSTYYSTSTQSSNLLLQGLEEQSQLMEESIHESISLTNLSFVNSSAVTFLATNTGDISIPAVSFGEMDVFLQYSTNSSINFLKPYFHPNNSSDDSWRVTSVTTLSGTPETLNPISLPSASSGQWDPSEVLHIVVAIGSSSAIDGSTGIAVRMCTPAGVCSSVSA
jgi:archaellum component FlaF (FlaF/FlaG flagellin family)